MRLSRDLSSQERVIDVANFTSLMKAKSTKEVQKLPYIIDSGVYKLHNVVLYLVKTLQHLFVESREPEFACSGHSFLLILKQRQRFSSCDHSTKELLFGVPIEDFDKEKGLNTSC